MVEKSLVSRQEAKIRELESKLEFEKTQVKRLEVSVKHRWRHDSAGSSRLPGDPGSSLWKTGRRRVGEKVLLQRSEIRVGRGKGHPALLHIYFYYLSAI